MSIRLPAIAVASLAVLTHAAIANAQSELPKGGVFEPRVEAAVQYAANINLAENSRDQIDTAGLEVSPGFMASYSSGFAIAAIDYSLVARAWEDSDYDDVSHRLNANGEWIAVPEWFRIQGQASYADSVIDPAQGLNYGGLGIFGAGNLSEVAAASISPILQHQFNDYVAVAQYTYGRTWYLDEGKGLPVTSTLGNGDSIDESAGASFGTADRNARVSGKVFYDWQRSEFDDRLPYEYERVGFDAGVQVARTIRVVGDVGRESDLEASTVAGGLDSDFWSAGLRWDPNENTTAEARYGDRFFGESYSFSASHRARVLEFTADYSEEPMVETRRLSLRDIIPGELPPGLPDIDLGLLTSDPFVAKDARLGVTAKGSRTTVGLRGYLFERDYIRGTREDETSSGVVLLVDRQLASNLSADFTLSYTEFERTTGTAPDLTETSSDNDTQALIRLTRTAGERLSVSGETGYLIRSGDLDYDGWWVAMRATWTP